VHRDGEYALIHVLDPARAAQYSALVEQHHLSGARSRTEEEARFHAQHLGPAALIIAEVQQSPEGFDLLRRLRKGKQPQVAPALLISGSLQVRNEAMRLRDQLGIVEILTSWQPLNIVRDAVARAIRGGPRSAGANVPEVALPAAREFAGAGAEDLLQAAARELGAPVALAWFGSVADGELLGFFGWDRSLVAMIGERADWVPFRNLAILGPLFVADAHAEVQLAQSAMVRAGLVRSFAGAPLCNDDGHPMGALWVADDRPGRFGLESLDALGLWAQRLGTAWTELARTKAVAELHAAARQETFKPSETPATEAMAQLLAHSGDGFIASDDQDRIAFGNPAAARLLGLKGRRLSGITRTHLLELACDKGGLDPRTAAQLLRATFGTTLAVTLTDPHRVLRWETKALPLGAAMGRMDQLVDMTAEREERETRERLARVDPLTWLSNRRGFDDALAREISRAFRFRTPLTLALFRMAGRENLDPAEADKILREVGWLVAEMSRGYDHAARLEDDSLALILPGATPEAAGALSLRLAEEVGALQAGRAPGVKLLTGIAIFDPGEGVAQMLARARALALQAETAADDGALHPSSSSGARH
jgi:GGDEF domain-containing protein